MKTAIFVALLGLLAISGAVATVGPDDVVAAAAVGDAVVHGGLAIKVAAKKIAIAKKHEAFVEMAANRKVEHAVAKAMRHAGPLAAKTALLGGASVGAAALSHADPANPILPLASGVAGAGALAAGGLTAGIAAKDAMRVAKAVEEANEMKLRAKAHTAKVVGKAVARVVAVKAFYGGKAALAVGAAALNDAAVFAPILAGIAPAVLPTLASGLAGAAPAGIQGAVSSLARAIGGALVGNGGIGVAGPDLLANRVAGLLPEDLLSGLPTAATNAFAAAPAAAAAGGAGGPDLMAQIMNVLPPEALDAVVGFLNDNPAVADNLPTTAPNGDLVIPAAAVQAMLRAITGLMGSGQAPVPAGSAPAPALNLSGLSSLPGGLALPLAELSNLLGVLPRGDLMGVLGMLPRSPLAALVRDLPLGLMGI